MIIVELDHNGNTGLGVKNQEVKVGSVVESSVEVTSTGYHGKFKRKVTKKAQYSDRIWPGHNPNFLLSGQLSGFDSIDYRTKIDPQHIIKPEKLHSTFDEPASITINITNWTQLSHIYIVITSYKYLGHGQRCQEHKEFDCSAPGFMTTTMDHMCMSMDLSCDGLPNCGQDYLPNQDENCFKNHWSSILLSLVSYILLAITLLLCLSCFARALIQWSVRSSLVEFRSVASPTGSFRSSSRFFSFLGTTFSGRWERPPPTYDEAMKHVNPDLHRPQAPPAYSDSCRVNIRRSSAGNISTPPPEYQSRDGLHRLHLDLDNVAGRDSRSGRRGRRSRSSISVNGHHHHHHHRSGGHQVSHVTVSVDESDFKLTSSEGQETAIVATADISACPGTSSSNRHPPSSPPVPTSPTLSSSSSSSSASNSTASVKTVVNVSSSTTTIKAEICR